MPSSASIRETLQARSELIRSANPSAVQLPEELQGYHSLSPLESITVTTERRKFGNWYSTVYKAINSSDGGAYALRRIESVDHIYGYPACCPALISLQSQVTE